MGSKVHSAWKITTYLVSCFSVEIYIRALRAVSERIKYINTYNFPLAWKTHSMTRQA